MKYVKAFWYGLPDGLRRAINTFWQTFLSVFLIGIADILQSTSVSNAKTALYALAVAAFASALSAFKTALVTR